VKVGKVFSRATGKPDAIPSREEQVL